VNAPSASAEKTYRAAVICLAIAASGTVLYFGRLFFITVIFAFIIAFLLEPGVRLLMRIRMPRGVASFLACTVWLGLLYLAGLALWVQAQSMILDLPAYGERINELVEGGARRMETFQTNIVRTLVPKRFQDDNPTPPPDPAAKGKRAPVVATPPQVQDVRVRPERFAFVGNLYNYLQSFYDVVLMASFVPFLVYFILSWGDHLRSRLLFTLEGQPRYTLMKTLDGVGDMVRAYVIGNFLLGLLLSAASAILFRAVSLPYWPIVAPMSGFLSLVPYLGLPLALSPPLLAALPLPIDPTRYLFLTVSVALLHLIAMNLLYPKFVGARVHLNPLVVTIALMLWGMLWGGIGLILAIPITASIKAVCDNVEGLRAYGRLLGD
jgi:predicted PurR-regulated permease PerM